MSNKTTPPKEIFIFKKTAIHYSEPLNEKMLKYISEQHHNEIVQQYEKKIGELLYRLVVKQNEVIEMLKSKA
jgi:hypothetical protein